MKHTFAELVDRVAADSGASKSQVAAVLHDLREVIADGLQRDGYVRWRHFGRFEVHAVPARQGRNPRSGAPLLVAAHTRVSFRADVSLRTRVGARSWGPLPVRLRWPRAAVACFALLLPAIATPTEPEATRALPHASSPARFSNVVLAAPKLAASPIASSHRVAPGETLSSIARHHYGHADQWRLLFAANPHLRDPNVIRVGSVLRLPP